MAFEWLIEQMKKHLRPLHVKTHVKGLLVNKILINEGVAINLMPRSTFVWLRKQPKHLIPSNIIVTDFNDKMPTSKGIVLVNL